MIELQVDAANHCLEYEPTESWWRLRTTVNGFTFVLYMSHEQAQCFAAGVECWRKDTECLNKK